MSFNAISEASTKPLYRSDSRTIMVEVNVAVLRHAAMYLAPFDAARCGKEIIVTVLHNFGGRYEELQVLQSLFHEENLPGLSPKQR